MKKKIYCHFFQKKMTALNHKIYPGKLGEKIHNNISKKAWNLWNKKQIIFINEKKLNMSKTKHQKILEKKMINFLFKKKKSCKEDIEKY
ncbi:oxidative damage protection protein [Buchnera aphidicola]|uniref:oxidative damage protection protein n=1 Tax=Buchnera aphidicola TaxID=9 RepID=UPI0034641949